MDRNDKAMLFFCVSVVLALMINGVAEGYLFWSFMHTGTSLLGKIIVSFFFVSAELIVIGGTFLFVRFIVHILSRSSDRKTAK